MKRCNDFENNFAKKLKADEAKQNIWGDDSDIDDLDLLRATQIWDEEEVVQQNTSVAPCYSAFKFNQPISSTQVRFNESFGLTRENEIIQDDVVGLEQKLRKLQTCFEAKEGEVTILRTQLKKTTERLEGEMAKKQKELSEKLNSTQREKEEAVTKLDLKDLELANLRRKLLDVQKNAARDMMTQSFSRSKIVNSTVAEKVEKKCHKLEPILKQSYPLKHITQSLIFQPTTEDQLEIADFFKNDSGRLGSAVCLENSEGTKHLIARSNTKLEDVLPEIGVLLNCDENELELRDDCTGKLAIVSLQLLDEMWVYLRELEMQIKEDYIRRWDLEYLNDKEQILKTERTFFDPLPWRLEERGIRSRQLLALLAEILPYNSYLRNYVIKRSALYKHQDCISQAKFANGGFIILNRITEIIQKIGQMRKSSKFSGFLSAVCHLVCRIFQSVHLNSELCDDLHNIIREVIFSRPNALVLNHVSHLLEQASIHELFVNKLCRLPENNGLIKKSKKGIFLINKDCCTFQVFSILYKECISNKIKLDIEQNTVALKFNCNAFNSKAGWLYYRENQHDECLYEVCSLSLEVISAALEQSDSGEDVKNVLELSVKVLRLIIFKCYDLLERKVDVYGQLKKVIMKIKEKSTEFQFSDYDVGALKKIMNTSTEDPQHNHLNINYPLWDDM